MVPRFYFDAKQHLQRLFEEHQDTSATSSGGEILPAAEQPFVIGGAAAVDEASVPRISPRTLVGKYDGTRITARAKHWYERTTDARVSPTDPDASPMKRFNGDRAVLGYHAHYVVDGGKARIILAALVTPASIMDNTPMLDLARWVRFRWHLKPKIAVGDTKYGTIDNIAGLEQDGIRAYLPRPDNSRRTKLYPPERFRYDPERDLYICPQGEEVPYWYRRSTEEVFVYRADAEVCNACPVKTKCTKSTTGRHIFRSYFQQHLDRAEEHRRTEAYHKAMRKRKLWPEGLFAEAKQWHQARRFRLRGLGKVNTEGLMAAAGQNLKRLLTYKGWGKRQGPAGWGTALALEPSFSFS